MFTFSLPMTSSRWGKYYLHDTNVETAFVMGYVACVANPHKLVADLTFNATTFSIVYCLAPFSRCVIL